MSFFKKMIAAEMSKSPLLISLVNSTKTIIESMNTCFDTIKKLNDRLTILEVNLENLVDVITAPYDPTATSKQFDDLFEEKKDIEVEETDEDVKKRLN